VKILFQEKLFRRVFFDVRMVALTQDLTFGYPIPRIMVTRKSWLKTGRSSGAMIFYSLGARGLGSTTKRSALF
jgi:hypothetical protein